MKNLKILVFMDKDAARLPEVVRAAPMLKNNSAWLLVSSTFLEARYLSLTCQLETLAWSSRESEWFRR